MRKRIIVVYNPRSSKAERVRQEVLETAKKLSGTVVGRYEVRATNVDDNAHHLAKVLADGDTVIVAGGDGTAAIGMNACMLAEKDVQLAVLPYGNFNDTARTFGVQNVSEILNGKTVEAYPLQLEVDGQLSRYALSYITLGLLAASTQVFERKKTRRHLQKGQPSLFFSIRTLAKWYFGHKKAEFLPTFRLNGQAVPPKTSDFLAVNSPTVARIMRGGAYYKGRDFLSGSFRLQSLPRLLTFMFRSILKRIPGKQSSRAVLEFAEPATVSLQAEGELIPLQAVQKIVIKKAAHPLKLIARR